MHRANPRISRRTFLAATAALGSAAAAGPGQAFGKNPAGVFRAGAATTKITPQIGVSLDGYMMKLGPAEAVHDDLHARCLALDDGRERLAICVCDLCTVPGAVFDRAKQIVHQRSGLPVERMLMAATHTHSAPRIGVAQGDLDKQYVDFLVRQIATAVLTAIEKLAPARLGCGAAAMPQYTYNRRWWMKPGTIPANPFGDATDQVLFNPPAGSKNLLRPAGPVDPQLSVLSVQHSDGRPMAVLANYSIHYAGGFARAHVSADYFGVFARQIGELVGGGSDFVGVLSNGTSGNIGAGVDFRKPPKKFPAWSRMQELGQAAAEEAARVVQKIEHRDGLSLAMREKEIPLAVRRPGAERLEWAKRILAATEAKHAHRWTPLYAKEALLLAEYAPTVPVKLQTLRIGPLAIAAIPCEVFAETGLAIKKASPLENTFVMELANQYYGYLPTPEQHALGGYETWPARSSCLEIDAASKIRAALLEMLQQMTAEDERSGKNHA